MAKKNKKQTDPNAKKWTKIVIRRWFLSFSFILSFAVNVFVAWMNEWANERTDGGWMLLAGSHKKENSCHCGATRMATAMATSAAATAILMTTTDQMLLAIYLIYFDQQIVFK